MANTLTAILPTIFEALDTVSRELVGFIPAVRRDTGVERAAKGQTITSPVVPAQSAEDITPGQLPADSGSQTIGATSMTISKSRAVPFLWNGEEQRSLSVGDRPQLSSIQADQFAQAFRTLANEVETDLAGTYTAASRAYGVAGTTPFATAGELDDFSETKRILMENGAPSSDLHLILDEAAMAKILGFQGTLFKVNEAGTPEALRNGAIGRVQGMNIGVSAQVQNHTAGTASGATTDTTGYAVGSTDITLAVAGTGTILAGDVISFDGVAGQYVVVTGDSDVSGGGSITIAEPGLIEAIPASATAITVAATSARNMAFDRNAIVLASRLPALPEGGDSADDRMTITDPVSGLSFEVSMYRQYRQVKIEVALAWGVKAIKTEHIASLLG